MVRQTEHNVFVGSSFGETDVAKRFREQISPKIQGIEKVYVPFFEFEFLVTFDDNRAPLSGTYWSDGIMLSCRLLPCDFNEPRLVARRGGTLLPIDQTVEAAKDVVRQKVLSSLPAEINRKGVSYNLTLEFRGQYYVPFWVAYFQGSRPGMFDFIVFDSQTGEIDSTAKDVVDRGFLLLDEQKDKVPPWF